jgi:hypothetical protein
MMSQSIKSFGIPYRLESPEAISEAIRANLLDIGSQYVKMYSLAKKVGTLDLPPALRLARERVEAAFYRVDEKKIQQCDIDYHEIANLQLIDNFFRVEEKVSCAASLAEHDDFFSALRSLPEEIQRVVRIEPCGGPLKAYESIQAIRKFLQMEILTFIRTKRMKRIGMEELKRLLIAYTIFLPGNEDVLQGLRTSASRGTNSALFQNAIAELLFCRLPRLIDGLTRVEPKIIRQKFLSKVAKLDLTVNQKTNLYGYFNPNISQDDLLPILSKLDAVVRQIPIPDEKRQKLCGYIMSFTNDIISVQRLYGRWFLSPELKRLRKLYTPKNVMQYRINVMENIVRKYIHSTQLEFYPTKDWMDLCKGKMSSDCSGHLLGQRHLLTPAFFNIRIFRHSDWIGNIYMLDFTEESGCLLVDRIQIPRGIKAEYVLFFDSLRIAFEELFEKTGYESILLPLRISNHASIQKVFNNYKENLAKSKIRFRLADKHLFESLRQREKYYILCSREKPKVAAPDSGDPFRERITAGEN